MTHPLTRPARRARSDRAILAAARELLEEHGVRGLTIEGVADRSGVAKTTIYRRYRDRDELALAVLIEDTQRFRTPPDLGDTRKELLAFVKEATEIILRGSVIQGIASEIATNPDLGQTYRERIIDVRLAEVGEIVTRAIERGDLRPDTDVVVAHELLIGPLMYRLIFSGRPLDRRHAAQVVDAVLTTFAPAAGRQRAKTRR